MKKLWYVSAAVPTGSVLWDWDNVGWEGFGFEIDENENPVRDMARNTVTRYEVTEGVPSLETAIDIYTGDAQLWECDIDNFLSWAKEQSCAYDRDAVVATLHE